MFTAQPIFTDLAQRTRTRFSLLKYFNGRFKMADIVEKSSSYV
jgi:hypothetical protein